MLFVVIKSSRHYPLKILLQAALTDFSFESKTSPLWNLVFITAEILIMLLHKNLKIHVLSSFLYGDVSVMPATHAHQLPQLDNLGGFLI